MSEKRPTLEIIAPSIEEALAKGLSDLGLPEEAVEVEVLDSGARGLFGLGTRQARIRLIVRNASAEEMPAPAVTPVQEAAVPEPPRAPALEAQPPLVGEDPALGVARQTLEELLSKMGVKAQVSTHFGEPDEDKGRRHIHVDIHGDDLSILIGRRAETLNALQYISSLIVGKELEHSVSLLVDVEGYRARREQQLRQLARRMADQAIKTGRRQLLEPMPANERRVIHIELRDHPDVKTESSGEEPHRKVNIVPRD